MAKGATVGEKPDNSQASKVEQASAEASKKAKEAEAAAASAEMMAAAQAEESNLQADDSIKGKKLYKLTRPFWNGRVKVEAGEYYYFADGKAPKTAKLAEAPAAKAADEKK